MLYCASWLLTAIYIALPIAFLAYQYWCSRRFLNSRPLFDALGVVLWAVAIGIALPVIYAKASHAHAPITQILLMSYFAMGGLLLLRAFNSLLLRLTHRFHPKTQLRAFLWSFPLAIFRVGLLFGIGLPWVMATLMVYRPKVTPLDSPMSQMGVQYETVSFPTKDHVRIVGWWIPSTSDGFQSRRTVIVCHGLGSNKSRNLVMAKGMIDAGYNILAIDLRAHGESGGQITTYGDRECLDVLAAVRWLLATHPDRCEQIDGAGASLGGAALVAAAADPSPEGQHIDALAVYGTFDNLHDLVGTVMADYFPPSRAGPLGWLLKHVGMPIASLHAGVNLDTFSPGNAVAKIWPRPILVIHGTSDEIIRFEHGQNLYFHSLQPKEYDWVQQGTHNGIVDDREVQERVVQFFDDARQVL
jgi:pimeloyl-ACP methyl ester carboxylesterase